MAANKSPHPFTSETAREAQKRSVKKRKENKAKYEVATIIAQQILHSSLKTKDGAEVQTTKAMLNRALRKALEDGDLAVIRFFIELAGEMPAQQHDVTSGGESLANPLMGMSLKELRRMFKKLSKVEGK